MCEALRVWWKVLRVKRRLRQYCPEVRRMALETVEKRHERSAPSRPSSVSDRSR
jgi:hypothetical protein